MVQSLLRQNGDAWGTNASTGLSPPCPTQYIEHSDPYMCFGEYWDTCDYKDSVLDANQDRHRQVPCGRVWLQCVGV